MDWSSQGSSGFRPLLTQVFRDPHVYFLALALLYILFASSNWIFTTPDSIDPWVYHGYFRNLAEYKVLFFPGTYYGSRLSWILPGYIAYSVLPPLAANYALHVGLWYAAIFALYCTLRITAGRQVALIASLLLGSFVYFLRPLGSDYVDGPANVYFFLCLAFLTAAACSGHNRLFLALGGAFYAAVVYTNLFTITFAPVIAVYFLLLSRRSERGFTIRGAARSLAWVVSGVAALSVLLGFANYLIEGKLLFYLPSIQYVLATAGQPNPWKAPVSQWIGNAEWLIMPLVVVIAGLAALANRRFRESLAGPASVAAFLLAWLIMAFCEWRGIPVLQYGYYASYLTAPMFLVIGALLANPLERLKEIPAVLLAAALLLLNSLPLWGYNAFLSQLKIDTWPAMPLLFGAALVVCALLNGWVARWAMAAALIGCHLTCVSTGYAFADRHVAREPFVRISAAANTVDAVRQGEPVRFWYSKSDPRFAEFHALNSIYLWGYTMISNEFPAILPGAVYSPGSLLVIPSSSGDVLAPANEALQEKAYSAELVERREIQEGGVSYSLWFVRVGHDLSRLSPQTVQPCPGSECQNLVDGSAPAELPANGWIAYQSPGLASSINREAGGIHITTVSARFGNAVKYGPLVPAASGRYLFRLQFGLLSGGITFGALSEDETQWLARAAIPPSRRTDQTALLSVEAEAGKPFWLMTANNHPAGDKSSDFVIRELEAYAFPAGEALARTGSATQ